MNKKIGWINNSWGPIDELSIPINDRGLNYGDGIFETILIWEGKPKLLTKHLNRWRKSAKELGMNNPPKEETVLQLIHEGIEQCSLNEGNGSVRLNWSRGNSIIRGINLSAKELDNSTHRFWLELNSIQTNFSPVSAIISCNEKRNAMSRLNLHKTFSYSQSIQAHQEAIKSGYDEALLESSIGGICCGTRANLIIKRNDEYLTPNLQSGCLPGIMRQQGINSGLVKECLINIQPEANDQWLLINSLSCKPLYKVNNKMLEPFSKPKEFWLSLYKL